MKMLLKLSVALLLLAGSIVAHADCSYPKASAAFPNGATATEPEMVAAMQAFKAYDADVKAYSACLEQETKETAVGAAYAMQRKAMQAKKINAAVEELQTKAQEFNQQLRAFKARAG